MTHTVAIGEFEGPLGILLDLVERKKFEVTSISVADITAGYLERISHLEQCSPEDLSEFLALGARLLYVKSLALLPSESDHQEQAEELHRLELELDEYRSIKTAARTLAARTSQRTWPRAATEHLTPEELPLPQIQLEQLTTAFTKALGRIPAAPAATMAKQSVDPIAVMANLRHHLPAGFDLDHLLQGCANRLEVIVTFVCLLELIRDGSARAGQDHQFRKITVEAA
jgi:segregation and condensation protein A